MVGFVHGDGKTDAIIRLRADVLKRDARPGPGRPWLPRRAPGETQNRDEVLNNNVTKHFQKRRYL